EALHTVNRAVLFVSRNRTAQSEHLAALLTPRSLRIGRDARKPKRARCKHTRLNEVFFAEIGTSRDPMTPPRDNDLLSAYLATRDQDAFAQLVARHLDWIYSAALRLTRDRTLAEDVAQGVFLALSQKAAKLTSHPNLAGWLFQATHFAARTALRGERRRRALEKRSMQEQQHTPTAKPIDRYWGQIKDRLEDAVATLPRKDRE